MSTPERATKYPSIERSTAYSNASSFGSHGTGNGKVVAPNQRLQARCVEARVDAWSGPQGEVEISMKEIGRRRAFAEDLLPSCRVAGVNDS